MPPRSLAALPTYIERCGMTNISMKLSPLPSAYHFHLCRL